MANLDHKPSIVQLLFGALATVAGAAVFGGTVAVGLGAFVLDAQTALFPDPASYLPLVVFAILGFFSVAVALRAFWRNRTGRSRAASRAAGALAKAAPILVGIGVAAGGGIGAKMVTEIAQTKRNYRVSDCKEFLGEAYEARWEECNAAIDTCTRMAKASVCETMSSQEESQQCMKLVRDMSAKAKSDGVDLSMIYEDFSTETIREICIAQRLH